MREVVRRVCVCLFVVSFVFSGATWAACIDLPAAVAPAATAHSHHHADAAGQGARHHDADHHATAPDQGPPADHGHGIVVKCCSMAPVFSLAPNLSATPVTFSGAVISFRLARRDLTGFIAVLDPGIPKPIV